MLIGVQESVAITVGVKGGISKAGSEGKCLLGHVCVNVGVRWLAYSKVLYSRTAA